MKLYTLEEIKETLKAIDCEQVIDTFIQFADPIELPNDDEIEKAKTNQNGNISTYYSYGFLDGAKWMKEQILNQNK